METFKLALIERLKKKSNLKTVNVYLDNYKAALIQGFLREDLSGIVWSICLDCGTSAVKLEEVGWPLARTDHSCSVQFTFGQTDRRQRLLDDSQMGRVSARRLGLGEHVRQILSFGPCVTEPLWAFWRCAVVQLTPAVCRVCSITLKNALWFLQSSSTMSVMLQKTRCESPVFSPCCC